MPTDNGAVTNRTTYDRVRITLDHHGHSAKVEVNGVEIMMVTKLQLTLDGSDRTSRVTIELMPDMIEIDGEVSVLNIVKPDRIFIPRAVAEATSGGD